MADQDNGGGDPLSLSMWKVGVGEYGRGMIIATTTVVLVGVTTIWILFAHYLSSISMKRKLRGRPPVPPGSLGLPFIGETIQFVTHLNSNRMVSFFESREAKYGGTFKTSILGVPTVVVEPPSGNKFVFTNEGKLLENTFPNSVYQLLGLDSLSSKRGEEHRIARRHYAGFLSLEAVVKHLPQIEGNVVDHLRVFWQPPAGVPSDQFELSAFKSTQMFTFKLIAELCVSLKAGPEVARLEEVFQEWAAGLLQVPINLPGFAFRRALIARANILGLLQKDIARRRVELKEGTATPTQDILSCLLTQPDETGRMNTDSEIKENILTLLFAGHDTSSSALAMAIMYIAKHPEVRLRLEEEHNAIASRTVDDQPLTLEQYRDMKYTWRVIQETLRLQSPVVGTFRKATTDFEYNGFTIPKGWQMFWTNQRSHENPNFFDDPKRFNPARFEGIGPPPFTFIPFGGGRRLCPGNEFAKMEMSVFLHHLVRNYRWSLIDPEEEIIRGSMPKTRKGTPIKVTKI